ncbi:MAG: hypothetical protein KUG64_11185 [Cycloclasticus sp.]|nr:hypothetical protein [Cycloclasticus sp.]
MRAMVRKASYGGSFDADYQAVLDRATTQGYTHPTDAQNIINNQTIVNLKIEGIWDELDTLWFFKQDANIDFIRLNWKDPINFELTDGTVQPTFVNDEGITVGASDNNNTYFNTNFKPLTNAVKCIKLDSSLIFNFYNSGSTLHVFGGRTGNNTEQTFIRNIAGSWIIRHYGNEGAELNTGGAENHYQFSGNGAVAKRYVNGVLKTTTTNETLGTINDVDQYILKINGFTGTNTANRGLRYLAQGSNLESKQLEVYQILTGIY